MTAALADPVVATVLKRAEKRPRLLAWVLFGLCALVGVLAAMDGELFTVRMLATAVGVPALAALWLVIDHRATWWRRAARAMLGRSEWRSVPARVLRAAPLGRRAVLEVDGTVVRAQLDPAHQQVVARSGRVWVVGPDTAGTLLLLVDGARRMTGAEPAVAAARRGAEPGDGPFAPARTALRDLYRRASGKWLFAIVSTAVVTVSLSESWQPAAGWLGWGLAGLMAVWLAVDLAFAAPRHFRQVDTAQWAPAVVWFAKAPLGSDASIVRITGTVRADDGRELGIVFRATSLDLVGAITDGKPVHFSGPVAPGAKLLAACPEVPAVAMVKVSSARR